MKIASEKKNQAQFDAGQTNAVVVGCAQVRAQCAKKLTAGLAQHLQTLTSIRDWGDTSGSIFVIRMSLISVNVACVGEPQACELVF